MGGTTTCAAAGPGDRDPARRPARRRGVGDGVGAVGVVGVGVGVGVGVAVDAADADSGTASARCGGASGDVWDAYERVAERLRRTAYRVLRDGHDAEDAVHDTMLAAHNNRHLLRDPGALDRWLVRIARNTAVNKARRRRLCRPDARFGAPEVGDASAAAGVADRGFASRLTSTEPSVEAVVSLREELDAVPPSWRDAFRARMVRGLTFEQIAAWQGVSVACVKTRITRVRTRLRRSIET